MWLPGVEKLAIVALLDLLFKEDAFWVTLPFLLDLFAASVELVVFVAELSDLRAPAGFWDILRWLNDWQPLFFGYILWNSFWEILCPSERVRDEVWEMLEMSLVFLVVLTIAPILLLGEDFYKCAYLSTSVELFFGDILLDFFRSKQLLKDTFGDFFLWMLSLSCLG